MSRDRVSVARLMPPSFLRYENRHTPCVPIDLDALTETLKELERLVDITME